MFNSCKFSSVWFVILIGLDLATTFEVLGPVPMLNFSWWKVQHLNQSRSKGAPKVKFLAGLGEKNGWVVPNWNRLLNRALYMLQFKESEALFFFIDSLFKCTNQSTTTSRTTFIDRLYIRKMKFISNKNQS